VREDGDHAAGFRVTEPQVSGGVCSLRQGDNARVGMSRGPCRSRTPGPVVSRVKARVVEGSLDANPVRLVDAAAVPGDRTARKGRSDLQPTALFASDDTQFRGDFRQILVLAEDQCHIVLGTVSPMKE